MAINAHLQALIKANPVNQAVDYAFVDDVIRRTAQKHFTELAVVDTLRRENFKRRVGRHNSVYVYIYTLNGHDNKDQPIEKQLVYSAHTDGSRSYAYSVLEKLIAAGFNNDEYDVIVPLEFISSVQALLYEPVAGQTLLDYMTAKTPVEDLKNLLFRAARWVNKFHHFALPEAALQYFPRFNPADMNRPLTEVLTDLKQADGFQGNKLQEFIKKFLPTEQQLRQQTPFGLVYGDFHPQNIITDNLRAKGLRMIDFSDVALGSQLRDIGTFIQQLYFMGRHLYRHEELEELMKHFIVSYFGLSLHELSPATIQSINLYQAWNALRGFVYFFYQKELRQASYGMLEDAWRYLTLVLEQKNEITIYYPES